MTAVRIEQLDAANPETMAAWHRTFAAASTHDREYGVPWALEEKRARLLGHTPGEKLIGFAGYVDDELVSTGTLWLPLRDNLHLAGAEVCTDPEHRERGHGSEMLTHLTQRAHEENRRTLHAEAAVPYEGPADGAGHRNADFLTHRGFTVGIGDVMRVLELPADVDLLERLADEAAPHHAAYTLRQFAGPVPDDVIASFGTLIGTLMTEAPTGQLELEPEVFDADRIRAEESVLAEAGRTKHTTIAVARDGTVAAYSELVVPAHDPGRVYQWGTLVRRDHRGHRLGTATKARNLLWVQAQHPDRTLLVTYNAEVNSHMVSINDAMGFRPVERLVEFQRKLG
ncbi:MAG TPA: GNAT family N-acetyltransferase [Nocardioidaceae bacterium]|nr:GNAT family N-acetyltransferase [Nocardioidaceae bacterium]